MKKFSIKERKQLNGSVKYIVERKGFFARLALSLWIINHESEGYFCEFDTLEEAKRYAEYHSNPKEKVIE